MKIIVTVSLGVLLLAGCGVQSSGTFKLGFDQNYAAGISCSGRAAGSSFPSPDGCNTCSCDSSGHAVCTLRGCQIP